jgi:hypothetical protein
MGDFELFCSLRILKLLNFIDVHRTHSSAALVGQAHNDCRSIGDRPTAIRENRLSMFLRRVIADIKLADLNKALKDVPIAATIPDTSELGGSDCAEHMIKLLRCSWLTLHDTLLVASRVGVRPEEFRRFVEGHATHRAAIVLDVEITGHIRVMRHRYVGLSQPIPYRGVCGGDLTWIGGVKAEQHQSPIITRGEESLHEFGEPCHRTYLTN